MRIQTKILKSCKARVFQTQIALWTTELKKRRRDGYNHDSKISKLVAAFKEKKEFSRLSKKKKQFIHSEEDWFLELQIEKRYLHNRTVEAVKIIRECEEYIDTLHRQKRVLAGDARKNKARRPRRARRSYRSSPTN